MKKSLLTLGLLLFVAAFSFGQTSQKKKTTAKEKTTEIAYKDGSKVQVVTKNGTSKVYHVDKNGKTTEGASGTNHTELVKTARASEKSKGKTEEGKSTKKVKKKS